MCSNRFEPRVRDKSSSLPPDQCIDGSDYRLTLAELVRPQISALSTVHGLVSLRPKSPRPIAVSTARSYTETVSRRICCGTPPMFFFTE